MNEERKKGKKQLARGPDEEKHLREQETKANRGGSLLLEKKKKKKAKRDKRQITKTV